jgi:hypothetical protein
MMIPDKCGEPKALVPGVPVFFYTYCTSSFFALGCIDLWIPPLSSSSSENDAMKSDAISRKRRVMWSSEL